MTYTLFTAYKHDKFIDQCNTLEKEGWILVSHTLTYGGVHAGIFHKTIKKEDKTQ